MNSDEHPLAALQSIDDVITALFREEPTSYHDIMRAIKLPTGCFEEHSSWCDQSYTRNCLVDSEKFELILLCWGAGQITPIHSHGGEECWVKIIEGEFQEIIYTADESGELTVIKSMISKPNDISYMIDFMGFHSLQNLSDKKSMSLHLYAKPIRSCKVFDEDLREFVTKDLAYDTASHLVAI